MCKMHPGREQNVCGVMLCAGCSEAEFLTCRLPKEVSFEPFPEPGPKEPLMTPEQSRLFRELVLSSTVKEYSTEERASFS